MVSYFEHSRQSQIAHILEALEQGDVALVSEAGTPLLSDPGYKLVQAVIKQGSTVVPLPGPSALTTALSAGGLPTDSFLFLGFLPRKSGERRRTLSGVAGQPVTLIFFESPHRIVPTLADMVDIFGAERSIAVCRELTKIHEEIWRGTLTAAQQEWNKRKPRGEFTLVVSGAPPSKKWNESEVKSALLVALSAGDSAKDAVKQVTRESGWPKRQIYQLAQSLKEATKQE